MKKAFLALILVVCIVSPAFALDPGEAPGYGKWDLGSTKHPWKDLILTGDATIGDDLTANDVTIDGTLIFDGTSYDTTLTFEEPSQAQAPTVPDMVTDEGTFQLSVATSGDISTTTATNTTVDAYTLVVAAGTLDAGDFLTFSFAGEKSATNAVGAVNLQLGAAGAEANALTIDYMSGDTDFVGEISIYVIKTGSAFISGWILGNTASGATGVSKVAQYTTRDFLTQDISCQIAIQSENGSDVAKLYYVRVKQN